MSTFNDTTNKFTITYFINNDEAIISSITKISTLTSATLTIPSTIPSGAHSGKDIIGIMNLALYSLKTESITTLNLPPTLSYIGKGTFTGFTNLTTIGFGTNPILTSIGEKAFSGCTGLTSVTIPSSVTTIGIEAFKGCTSLGSVNFTIATSKLLSIGNGAFYGCTGLTGTLSLPATLSTIGNEAFYNCNLIGTLSIPKNVTSIGMNAFYSNGSLTSIDFHPFTSKLNTIGNSAFEECVLNYGSTTTPGTTLTLPASLKTIGEDAFFSNPNLKSVTFPANSKLVSIGKDAFPTTTTVVLPTYTTGPFPSPTR
jgi:hypothetical protein